jgi:hypothetical protein
VLHGPRVKRRHRCLQIAPGPPVDFSGPQHVGADQDAGGNQDIADVQCAHDSARIGPDAFRHCLPEILGCDRRSGGFEQTANGHSAFLEITLAVRAVPRAKASIHRCVSGQAFTRRVSKSFSHVPPGCAPYQPINLPSAIVLTAPRSPSRDNERDSNTPQKHGSEGYRYRFNGDLVVALPCVTQKGTMIDVTGDRLIAVCTESLED